jgi:membrane protease YdiL (CAAX protease family)
MNKITDWIKRYQIAAFFIITFAITWGLGFSFEAVLKRNQFLLLPAVFLASCGPGLAGIIISVIINTQPRQGPRKVFWIAFLAAWFVSALVCLANFKFIEQNSLSPAAVGLFAVSVVPVAFVIASAWSRIPSVKSHLASLIQLRGMWGWALVALGLFPVLHLISFPINSILNRELVASYPFPDINLSLVGLVIVKFLYQFFFFNATGEETGWRGFALPRLQARTSPFIAALIIAFFWTPFHLFWWQAVGQPVSDLQYWIVMYIGHILLSVLIAWIYNRANGSILVAGIAHAATNTVQAFIPVQNILSLYLTLFVVALILILADRMWKKLPSDHPAVFRSPRVFAQRREEPTLVPVLK